MNDNQKRHLNHDFYRNANVYREGVRKGQILKGADKYPEPFNPKSWTPRELLEHAMQENVDQGHYIFGLYEKLEEMERQTREYQERINKAQLANFYLNENNVYLRNQVELLQEKVKYYESEGEE